MNADIRLTLRQLRKASGFALTAVLTLALAPIVNSPQISEWFSLEERSNHNAWAIGHLKPGVTPAAATSDLNTIANSLAKIDPKSDG